jgi:hypothetical protein
MQDLFARRGKKETPLNESVFWWRRRVFGKREKVCGELKGGVRFGGVCGQLGGNCGGLGKVGKVWVDGERVRL